MRQLVFSAKNLNATQAAEPFYSVYKELHSDPGKIIETITADFKKMHLIMAISWLVEQSHVRLCNHC